MDGGLSSNNPSLLALQEAHRLAPELKRPDQFISVGTGVSKAGDAHVANTLYSRQLSTTGETTLMATSSLPACVT
jgi:hypothetical protein